MRGRAGEEMREMGEKRGEEKRKGEKSGAGEEVW